ncbi:MAG: rRNA maturation RNase YbeY [Christensenellales bacterium]
MKHTAIDIFWDNMRPSGKFSRVISRVIRSCAELYGKRVAVCVTVTGNGEIRALNREYRGIDKETDVLSFPTMEFTSPLQPVMEEFDPARKAVALGDIVISLDKAKEQAAEYETTLVREMAFLTVHGMLHLFGYDHERSMEEEEKMCALQEKIVSSLGYDRKKDKAPA